MLTAWTTDVVDAATAISGGWQPPKYGQVDAELARPANFLDAPSAKGSTVAQLCGIGRKSNGALGFKRAAAFRMRCVIGSVPSSTNGISYGGCCSAMNGEAGKYLALTTCIDTSGAIAGSALTVSAARTDAGTPTIENAPKAKKPMRLEIKFPVFTS